MATSFDTRDLWATKEIYKLQNICKDKDLSPQNNIKQNKKRCPTSCDSMYQMHKICVWKKLSDTDCHSKLSHFLLLSFYTLKGNLYTYIYSPNPPTFSVPYCILGIWNSERMFFRSLLSSRTASSEKPDNKKLYVVEAKQNTDVITINCIYRWVMWKVQKG